MTAQWWRTVLRWVSITACVFVPVVSRVDSAWATASPGPHAALPGRPISWLAAGDSYSSGQGLTYAAPPCARGAAGHGHSGAWPVEAAAGLVAHSGLRLLGGSPKFVACSGYTTQQFFNSDQSHPAEWQNSDHRYDLVTFTFGGDNIGFSTIIQDCLGLSPSGIAGIAGAGVGGILGGPYGATVGGALAWKTLIHCPPDQTIRGVIASKIGGANGPYMAFLDKVAADTVRSGGNIVVLGYPELVEDPKFWGTVDSTLGSCQGISVADAYELRGLAGDLNASIAEAVKAFDSQPASKRNNVEAAYVDVNTGNPSQGVPYNDPNLFEPSSGSRHNLCAANEWLNGIEVPHVTHSFHPNQPGNDAMARLFQQVFPRLNWSNLTTPLSLVTSELASDTSGLKDDIVAVPGGYDALAFDQAGHYYFWTYRGYAWTKESEWTFPQYPIDDFPATVEGKLLPGMTDATFIVTGPFTGDGSGNNLALTGTGKTWGPLAETASKTLQVDTAAGETQLPSILHALLAFTPSGLRSEDDNPAFTAADSRAYPTTINWTWSASHFIDSSDNIFTATAAAPAPAQNPPLLPARSCPAPSSSGTYSVGLSAAMSQNGDVGIDLSVQSASAGFKTCSLQIPATTPLVIQVTTSAGVTESITAPLWLLTANALLAGNIPGSVTPLPLPSLFTQYGEAPYYVPPGLDVQAVSVRTIDTILSQYNSEGAYCAVTYKSGVITSIALLVG